MSNRVAILPVSPQLLVDALQLPKGTRVTDARTSFDSGMIEFKIEHEDFEPVEFGYVAPVLTPRFAYAERFIWFKRVRAVVFLGWAGEHDERK